MEPTQSLILGLAPVFIILAMILIVLQTLRRRKARGLSMRATPLVLAIALYGVGVAGLLFATYGPPTGPVVRYVVVGLFFAATAILVLAILRQRPSN